jgi:toxin ParE1/3/4
MERRLVIRPQAVRDIDGHSEYLALNRGERVAERFQQMVEEKLTEISEMPELGSIWESAAANLQGIRFRTLRRFRNHVVFYRVTDHGVEIVRLLHASQNLEERLQESDE